MRPPDDIVFSPAPETVARTQLTAFRRFCESETGSRIADHAELHELSVRQPARFWRLYLDWSGLMVEGGRDPVCTDDRSCEHAVFFPQLRLGYADNLLRVHAGSAPDRPVLIARHAQRSTEHITLDELRTRVARAAAAYERLGVVEGDRIVAIARNNAEVVVAALAAAAIGATFSSAPPEMGAPTIRSRFEQLAPAVLVANLSPEDDARLPSLSQRVGEVAGHLPSLKAIVALDDGPRPADLRCPVRRITDLTGEADAVSLDRRFDFNHPLFVLFTSGTTGPPKCIVHGAGGTLLEHTKEHRLHHDLGPTDRLLFQTSTGWMMWNWQLSALASGAAIVVYDGPIEGPETLWRIVAEERVTVFGTSPPYLRLCAELDYAPRRDVDLAGLRAVLSTGSALQDHQYDWVRDHVGSLPLQSISGGTDIIGCFALGNPNLPVRRGRLQCRSLGLDVQALVTEETPAGGTVGELVCRTPFPSRPLGFVGDDDGARFHEAYFSQNPGVWTHGDLIDIDADGSVRVHGRSDGVLNVDGMRIGPAELYAVLDDFREVREALAVEQQTPDDVDPARVVLLVVMVRPGTLDEELAARMRRELARRASAAHVPRLIVEVEELPTTHSGKRSERAARDAVNGVEVANLGALANPDSIARIRDAVARIRDAVAGASGQRTSAPATGGDTADRLRAMWETLLGISPIGPDDNFFEVGGTSLAAVRLLNAIHEELGVDLPLSVFLHAQTIDAMAQVLDGSGDELDVLVPLKPGGDDRPLFVVHGLIGDIYELRELVQRLDTGRPVIGIRARGLDPRVAADTSVEAMAEAYIGLIRQVQPHGPYALAGYSFGGLVAFEMARQIVAGGGSVDHLVLLDTYVHERCLTSPGRAWFAVSRAGRLLARGLRSPRTKLPRFLRRVAAKAGVPRIDPPVLDDPDLPPLLRHVEQVNMAAYEAYEPGLYRGAVHFIWARRREPRECNPLPVWRRAVRGALTIERVPGGHFEMMTEPWVQHVAERVTSALRDAPLTP